MPEPEALGGETDMKAKAARLLHANGFSLRQIQRALGFSSVNSVQYLLKIGDKK